MTQPVAPPNATEPVLASDGTLTLGWRRFLEGLWTRTGRFQQISVTATSDTNLRFSYKGSDGVVRTGNLTIS